MAVINGAKSVDEVAKTVKAGFSKVLRVRALSVNKTSEIYGYGLQITWMTSPLYTIFAQQFLPPEMWVPFFNFMQFLTGVGRSNQTPW